MSNNKKAIHLIRKLYEGMKISYIQIALGSSASILMRLDSHASIRTSGKKYRQACPATHTRQTDV